MRPMNLFCHALNVALPADGSLPEWVELIPAGPRVDGVDGRGWINDQPDQVVAYHVARNKPLVIDWEHATEHKAPKGEEAPAAGWVDVIENRGGAIWGRVEWTQRAANQIGNREYRFLSPVFVYQKSTGRIVALSSIGLTNTPNLTNKALNSVQFPFSDQHEETPMPLPVAICQALSLPETATEQQAAEAIARLRTDLSTAQNRAENPELAKFVPRADYDAALTRATNAEQKLADNEKAQLDGEIEQAVQGALEAGKITPATADYYKAQCRTEGGLAAFKAFVEKAPAVIGGDAGLDKKPNKAGSQTMTDEHKAICRAMGLDEAEYAKNLEEAN